MQIEPDPPKPHELLTPAITMANIYFTRMLTAIPHGNELAAGLVGAHLQALIISQFGETSETSKIRDSVNLGLAAAALLGSIAAFTTNETTLAAGLAGATVAGVSGFIGDKLTQNSETIQKISTTITRTALTGTQIVLNTFSTPNYESLQDSAAGLQFASGIALNGWIANLRNRFGGKPTILEHGVMHFAEMTAMFGVGQDHIGAGLSFLGAAGSRAFSLFKEVRHQVKVHNELTEEKISVNRAIASTKLRMGVNPSLDKRTNLAQLQKYRQSLDDVSE